MSRNVLIYSDTALTRERVALTFNRAGYLTVLADSHETDHDSLLANARPDLVVIAPSSDRVNAAGLCTALRRSTGLPLLITPAIHDDLEELSLLGSGADDYVSRDRPARSLIARCERLVKRSNRWQSIHTEHRIGRFVLDADRRSVTWDEVAIDLTRIEFEIMHILCANRQRVVRRAELIATVWGEWFGDDHVLEVHLSRLRRKLRINFVNATIRPIRGVGYQLILE